MKHSMVKNWRGRGQIRPFASRKYWSSWSIEGVEIQSTLLNGHLELVPAFLYSPYLTLHKMDTSLRWTLSASPKGVRLRESWLYSQTLLIQWNLDLTSCYLTKYSVWWTIISLAPAIVKYIEKNLHRTKPIYSKRQSLGPSLYWGSTVQTLRGAKESVHINRVSVLRGLNLEKMRGLSFLRDKANCP